GQRPDALHLPAEEVTGPARGPGGRARAPGAPPALHALPAPPGLLAVAGRLVPTDARRRPRLGVAGPGLLDPPDHLRRTPPPAPPPARGPARPRGPPPCRWRRRPRTAGRGAPPPSGRCPRRPGRFPTPARVAPRPTATRRG